MSKAGATKRPPQYPEEEKPGVRDLLSQLADLEVSVRPKPEKNIRANIVDFSIETNSVVATATVRTDDTMKRILVDWGDGNTNTLNARPGIHLPFPGEDPLPPGTYRFHHAYAEPEDRQPFDYFVLVRVEDKAGVDFRIRQIRLTPRYRVTNYRTRVRLAARCDSIFESTNEFDITQLVDGVPVNQWRWEPSNNFFGESQFFRLENSGVTRELTLADGFVSVVLELIERDPFFDEHLTLNQGLSATQNSERVERTIADGGCKVIAQYDREVQLILPLPSPGPTLELAPG